MGLQKARGFLMGAEEIAFLAIVVGGLSIFGLVLGFVTWWSNQPAKVSNAALRTPHQGRKRAGMAATH
jgi:hypothetical protein